MSASGSPVAIMGGAFDPVHYGHLRTAVELIEELQLDELRFMPSGNPPHRKPHIGAGELRVRMLEAALAEIPACVIDQRELHREGPSWSVLTLEELRAEMPDRSLSLVLGMDAFLGLPAWHRWEELTELAHLIVAWRPGFDLPTAGILGELLAARRTTRSTELRSHPAGRIYVAEVTQLEISSSDIRSRLAAGGSIDFLLPPRVADIIHQTACYSSVQHSEPQEQSLDAK